MEKKLIRERLYQKYIEPTKKTRKDYIGVEIEMPILNLKKEAVDFKVVHAVTERFMVHFEFHVTGRDDNGNVYSAESCHHGDILSYDCSYNNLELSFGREQELHTVNERFRMYYWYLQKEFGKYRYTLTGMGVNPYRIYNHNVPIPNERYRMLFHHLDSYKNYRIPMFFHEYPEYGTFSSASQVQLDVSYEDLIVTLKAFSRLEPIKALLFSNSVLLEDHEEYLCCRDMFWENSTHGINRHNIGMFDCTLENEKDLLAYIETTSIYCVERDGKYLNFAPIRIMEYLQKSTVSGEYYENGEYHMMEILPRLEDIEYLRTFKFEDLTFRGTVEFRSVCCQPIKDSMTVAAFHLGLKKQVHRLNALLKEDHVIYHHGYTAAELRRMFVKSKLPGFVNEDDLYQLAKEILDLSREGLAARGYKEETMLLPLYERVELRMNPAQKMLKLRNQGMNLENIISEYGYLD